MKTRVCLKYFVHDCSLGSIFQLQQRLFFGTCFPKEEYFWSKTERVNITIDLVIFELV